MWIKQWMKDVTFIVLAVAAIAVMIWFIAVTHSSAQSIEKMALEEQTTTLENVLDGRPFSLNEIRELVNRPGLLRDAAMNEAKKWCAEHGVTDDETIEYRANESIREFNHMRLIIAPSKIQ
jgi:hypothetical protein